MNVSGQSLYYLNILLMKSVGKGNLYLTSMYIMPFETGLAPVNARNVKSWKITSYQGSNVTQNDCIENVDVDQAGKLVNTFKPKDSYIPSYDISKKHDFNSFSNLLKFV